MYYSVFNYQMYMDLFIYFQWYYITAFIQLSVQLTSALRTASTQYTRWCIERLQNLIDLGLF